MFITTSLTLPAQWYSYISPGIGTALLPWTACTKAWPSPPWRNLGKKLGMKQKKMKHQTPALLHPVPGPKGFRVSLYSCLLLFYDVFIPCFMKYRYTILRKPIVSSKVSGELLSSLHWSKCLSFLFLSQSSSYFLNTEYHRVREEDCTGCTEETSSEADNEARLYAGGTAWHTEILTVGRNQDLRHFQLVQVSNIK